MILYTLISASLIIGLCFWIYYCNKQIKKSLKKQSQSKIISWVYITMLSSVVIVGALMFCICEQLIDIFSLFYR